MKSIRLHAVGDLRIQDEPVPESGPGEALLRVTAIGICGSDLHWVSEAGIGDARLDRPLILGHEFAGVIADGPRRGERVAADPAIPCSECEFCGQGNPNLCTNLHFAGHGEDDGAMREFMTWPERCLHTLPETLTGVDGAMLEALGVAIHAIDLAHLKPGMSVGVFGCGPIGLLILQLARLSGATQTVVTDKLSHRLEAARALGAEYDFLATNDGQERALVWAATKDRGVDVAFEVAGENPAVETAIATVRPGGSVILVGIPTDDQTYFSASTARRKGLTIKLCRRMKHTYPRAIRLVENGLIDVCSLVTHCYSLAEYEEAFSVAIRREGIKVVLEP